MKASERLFIDAWELARQQRDLQGEAPLSEFERLLDGQPQQDPERKVDWLLSGATDGVGRRYVSLQADAVVTLECQRCLGMFDLPLHAENRVQLVETEAELEVDEDFEADPDAPDRVLGSAQFDVQSLIEDELILALPYVPKHEVCPSLPEGLETDEGSDTGRPSPFAVLAELKKD
jgi:uncharacterized protein